MNELIDSIAPKLVRFIPGLKPDISFQRDDAYKFLPRMIALVTTMVVFMLLLAISLGVAISQSSNMQRDTILIHIPAQESQEEIAEKLLLSLAESSDIKMFNQLSRGQLAEQMKPWLGQIEHMEELPMPILIRGRLAQEFSDATLENIRTQMQAIDHSVIVDAPAEWSANYSRFSKTLQWVLGSFSVALLLGMFGLMSFVATTAMKIHKRTVVLLHSIGATDNYIAAQFQINSSLLALKGAFIGTVLASLIYVIIASYIGGMEAAMLPDLSFRLEHLWVMLLLPLTSALVGFIAGRLASLRYLKQLM